MPLLTPPVYGILVTGILVTTIFRNFGHQFFCNFGHQRNIGHQAKNGILGTEILVTKREKQILPKTDIKVIKNDFSTPS